MTNRYIVWSPQGDQSWVKDARSGALITPGRCADLLNDRERLIWALYKASAALNYGLTTLERIDAASAINHAITKTIELHREVEK